jgi:hypothetical protein
MNYNREKSLTSSLATTATTLATVVSLLGGVVEVLSLSLSVIYLGENPFLVKIGWL